ncbi:hypothetical protein H4R18_002761 [Coemansia javaensis]|uniref:Nitrogen regulatory protein areA GATA-like domain-containing protein n=1 Tax=Coemansia javaensis TaxID=2761396 RepID=A0A9W8HC62_9FUNG|nr:hypothetical protein H4R18_002761 [Coemansia javaensis]
MDGRRALVDVLLHPDCNLYERYPELVHRVDYFLYDWCEETLARTDSLLRRQAQSIREQHGAEAARDDSRFTHTRSVNIVWRQWALSRLQLPPYPPERINWNKDADPVFLYGQVPALRLEVPWSTHSASPSPPAVPDSAATAAATTAAATAAATATAAMATAGLQLKPALKRTDLQTFLTSPTLSPASSPLQSPAVSIRENMSTSSFGSDETTLEPSSSSSEVGSGGAASQLKPRLRFNDRVEQCMVVFDQEKEYLPTDYEDDEDHYHHHHHHHNPDAIAASNNSRRRLAAKKQHSHRPHHRPTRRSLVIKLAPTHLKGDHRKLVAVAAPPPAIAAAAAAAAADYDSDEEEALFGAYDDGVSFASTANSNNSNSNRSNSTAAASTGVGGYIQGCVKTVAGQVRRLVGDSKAMPPPPREDAAAPPLSPDGIVSDPFAAHHQKQQQQQQQQQQHVRTHASGSNAHAASPSHVVRDPFSSAGAAPCDRVPFDDDEDAIIQQFEREMQKCASPPAQPTTAGAGAAAAAAAALQHHHHQQKQHAPSEWDLDDGMYESEYQLHMYDSEYGSELGPHDAAPAHTAGFAAEYHHHHHQPHYTGARAAQQQQQPPHARNESIIDRAEDTIVNTVDAVKWCASFISNYTIF